MIKTDINSTAEMVAAELLRINAVFLRPDEPFTWASGIKSPIYCDNRLILSHPSARGIVEEFLALKVSKEFPGAEILLGTSTAGIAHAALAANIMGLPMGYVRGSSKDHGRKNRIEGELKEGEKTVIIEDLISTGGSALDAAAAAKEAGADVLGVAAIFTYGLKEGRDAFGNAGVRLTCLSDLDALVKVAVKNKYIKAEQKNKILRFRDDPEHWYAGGKE
ncbi:MAG: orotate phosphoribosyltransferase [Anaerovoracaceae bacterium]|nr:orotate phosphoribosyltransferase [Anaerovoracaceae bacterium]